MSIPRNHELRE